MGTINGVPLSTVHSGAQAVAAGQWHSMALKTDGSVWTTGYKYHGQLGDGDTSDKHNFMQVLSGQLGDGVARSVLGSLKDSKNNFVEVLPGQ